MSIAQKGPTWLPRFLRKSETLPLDERTDPLPLDDRLGGGVNVGSIAGCAVEEAPVVTPVPAAERIHKLACVDARALIADDVEIGPFCVVGPDVRIGPGTKLMNNVTLVGHTTIGRNNLIFPNAVIGTQPQDKKFKGEETRVEIGDNNQIREAVTIHAGTAKGGGVTRVGSNNLLMVNTHLGHDVVIGDNCIFANNVMLAGHVHIGNNVVLSGAVGIHHFVTIGDFAYAGGAAKITHDVPPFVKVDEKDKIRGVNSVGLRRNGFSEDDVAAVEQIIWRLFLDRDREPMNVVLRKFRDGKFNDLAMSAHVNRVIEFLERRNLGRHGRYLEAARAG